MEPRVDVDVDAALRAFDQLEKDGPRIVQNELRNLATDAMNESRVRAPGKLKHGWRVEEMADPRTSETFGYAAMPSDITTYDARVARFVQYGTGSQGRGGKRVAHDESHPGVKPRRFLSKPSKRKQVDAIHRALIRTARRAGFDVGGPL